MLHDVDENTHLHVSFDLDCLDPMEAPGVGIGNQEQFTYQARAFLDQIAGVADPLPPNATFADGLRSMEIIEAVVRSSQSDGAAVAVAPPA